MNLAANQWLAAAAALIEDFTWWKKPSPVPVAGLCFSKIYINHGPRQAIWSSDIDFS